MYRFVMDSFSDIIKSWPLVRCFAEEVGVTTGLASAWNQRDSIPSWHWVAVIEAARRRGLAISLDDLARLAAGRH